MNRDFSFNESSNSEDVLAGLHQDSSPDSILMGPSRVSESVTQNLQSAIQSIGSQDFKQALDSLNRAIVDADPVQLAECYGLRGFVRLRMEQFELAEEDCTESIKRRGDDPETLMWRAAARAEQENWQGAFHDLALARRADPSPSGTYDQTMEGYLPSALGTFERQLQSGRNQAAVYFQRGYVHLCIRDYDRAENDFQSALLADEDCADALTGLGQIEICRGNFQQAIKLASRAMQLGPDALQAALPVRSEAYSGNGQLALAIEDAVRLRERVGDRVDGLLECAQLRTRIGDLSGAIEDLNIAADMNPELPVVLLLRASVFKEMRNYGIAKRDYVRYLSKVPGDERSWLQLGDLHLKDQNLPEARAAYDRALEIDEICSAAFVGRCNVMLAMGNATQAKLESERALRLDSRNPEIHLLRGKIFQQQQRFDQANTEFTKAADLANDRLLLGEILYLHGVMLYETGGEVQAIEKFKSASQLRPTHAGTHIWQAATNARLEQWPEVIDHLQLAIRLRPSAAQQYRKLGSPVAHKAVKHFDRMMRESGTTAELMRNRGRAYQFLGKDSEAIDDYSVAIDVSSQDYDTMIERARLVARTGRLDEAIADLSRVIRKVPDHDRAHYTRATALIEAKNYQAAIRDIDRAIELAPNQARYHVLKGDLQIHENKIKAAIDDYSQAIVLDPADHLAFRKRGSCYHKLQQNLYAIADLTRSNELFPGLAETHVLRGQAYLKNEQLENARADFEAALQIDDRQVRAFVGRANYLAQKGQHEESLILLTKAMQRFQDNPRDIAQLLMMRGKVFYQMGRFPPALTDFTSVMNLQREDKFSVAAARCARAVVLVQHGELIYAKKEFDRVLKRFPEHPLAKVASKWLSSGNGQRPVILLPPDRLIRPTRPPVVIETRQAETTDPRWLGEPPFDLWLVRTSHPREYGPITKEMLDDWVQQGRIDSKTRLLRCGWEKWRKAYRVYKSLRPTMKG